MDTNWFKKRNKERMKEWKTSYFNKPHRSFNSWNFFNSISFFQIHTEDFYNLEKIIKIFNMYVMAIWRGKFSHKEWSAEINL